jgi:uncharacterized membrane protein
MKALQDREPLTVENVVLWGSICLTFLVASTFFHHASSFVQAQQQDSTLLTVQSILLMVFSLLSILNMLGLILKTALGKLDYRMCAAGCGFFVVAAGMLICLPGV